MLKIIFINTVSNSSLINQWKTFVRKGTVILIENVQHYYKVSLYPVNANL